MLSIHNPVKLLTNKPILIYIVTIILTISIALGLMTNSTTKANASNNTDIINNYVINFQDGTNLSESQTILDEILSNNQNLEASIVLNTELETENLILPISISLETKDKQADIINKYKKQTNNVLEELKTRKNQDTNKLNNKTATDSTDSKSIYGLAQENVMSMNLTTNIDNSEINALSSNTQAINADSINTNSLEISVNDTNDSFDKKITKLAKNSNVNLKNFTDKKLLNKELNKSKKIKSTTKAKYLKTNSKFQAFQTTKKSEEDRLQKESALARPEFDALYKNNPNPSYAEIDKLVAKWQWTPKAIEIPTLSESIETNNIEQVSDTEVVNTNLETLTRINDNQDSAPVTPTLEKVDKNKTKNNRTNINQKKSDSKKNNKQFTAIKSITKLKIVKQTQSQAEIDANNAKIEAQRLKDLEYENQKSNSSTSTSSSPKISQKQSDSDNILQLLANMIFNNGIDTHARNLNNNNQKQTIYLWDNEYKALDIPGSNSNIGAVQMQIYQRNNTPAQRWGLWSSTQEIRSEVADNRCLDISGYNYSNGARVQVWNCTGSGNQKWFFDGTALRSYEKPEFCLDVSGGQLWTDGAKVQLYACNGSPAQRFVAGDYNWGASFRVEINASDTGFYDNGVQTGHVFLSYTVNGALVNTQSSWPGVDTNCDNNLADVGNNLSSYQRVNNMCDGDSAWIDKNEDMGYRLAKTGPGKDFRNRSFAVPKRISDIYRFNSGYRWGVGNYGRNDIRYTGGRLLFPWTGNCAYFSLRVWNNIMDDIRNPRLYPNVVDVPGDIYNVI